MGLGLEAPADLCLGTSVVSFANQQSAKFAKIWRCLAGAL
jgi:hypothetical protein